ncbi:hypothetical protein T492DRAFT_1108526 [Pavlovales sp. CCMP2436]|nr:hypothetical protein T492DRAFT_1108526 [Pavlovales sp. CCMP2436]
MASAAVIEHVRELVEFLSSGGQTQVKLALEHTAAFSGSEEGVAALLETGAAAHLHRLSVHPIQGIRSDAAATLANLCAANEPTCKTAADPEAGLVEQLCECLGRVGRDVDVTSEVALLANLSTQPVALPALAANAELLTRRLLESSDEGTATLAHVLVNAAQSPDFSTHMLRNDGRLLSELITSQLAHADGVRRQGAAGVFRNLCLGEYNHIPICRHENLLPPICARLIPCNADIDAEDLAKMAAPLRAAVTASLASPLPGTLEPEPSIRLMITEALLALTLTRLGREHLRKLHVYPVLRESHKREEDEGIGETIQAQNEEIVSLIEGEEERPRRAAEGAPAAEAGSEGAPAAAGSAEAGGEAGSVVAPAEASSEEARQ